MAGPAGCQATLPDAAPGAPAAYMLVELGVWEQRHRAVLEVLDGQLFVRDLVGLNVVRLNN